MKTFWAAFFLVALFTLAMAVNANAYNIGNDRGGVVIKYALRMLNIKESGQSVRFTGRCDSACTLFLALPKSKMCINKNASFGFHLPYGASKRSNAIAANYLMRSYPNWVRAWIRQKGGLSNRIKTMNYTYASQYIPACKGV